MARLIVEAGMAPSTSQARRLISQGAVKVNGEKVNDIKISSLKTQDIVQVGKRNFIKIEL
jgi:tyrosyl-tRNA synthetase